MIHTVAAGARRARADKVLAAAFPQFSRSAIQRAFAAGLVSQDGQPISQTALIGAGAQVHFRLPAAAPSELEPRAIPLEILFEDEHLLALNKPAGLVVHPGAGTRGDTLVHALLAHCAGQLSGVGGVERPGIVHRLDRETSGVILVAKTDPAHRGLTEQFAARTVQKEYLALVSGVPPAAEGSIREPIGRNPRARHKMAVVATGRGGRVAHTDWAVVERFGEVGALLRCAIHTGRAHQIRVHLKSVGLGLMGDTVYGYRPDPRMPAEPPRVMLHAERIVVRHPVTGRTLDLKAPIPADFNALVAALRRAAKIAQAGRPAASAARPQRRL